MCVQLDYRLSGRWDKALPSNPDALDAGDIHYELFLGDVIFKVGGADLSAPWGWVPILDFALQLRRILHELEEEQEQIFEFTESNDVLKFRRHGDEVVVVASYDGRGRVPYAKLRQATDDFSELVVRELDRIAPGLANNPTVTKAMTG